MLNKNIRSLLSYVAGVSLLCLMIEFSRRLPDTPATLPPALYHVRTAKVSTRYQDAVKCPILFAYRSFCSDAHKTHLAGF